MKYVVLCFILLNICLFVFVHITTDHPTNKYVLQLCSGLEWIHNSKTKIDNFFLHQIDANEKCTLNGMDKATNDY